VVLRRQLDQAELDAAVDWATGWFGQQVASGQITQSEADAIMQDIRTAVETGRTNGPEYYEGLLELGLISAETASRRLQMIAAMEQSWNRSPENLALRKPKLELMEVLKVLDVPIAEVQARGDVNANGVAASR
jgi:hypothetical protein